jgi:uncharacterized protein (AIM24 family)
MPSTTVKSRLHKAHGRRSSKIAKTLSLKNTMFKVNHAGVANTLDITIPRHEFVLVENGTILKMTSDVDLEMTSNIRGLLTNQSVFQVKAIAKGDRSVITLAPHGYGDILILDLGRYPQHCMHIMKSCFLASSHGVDLAVTAAKSIPKMLFSSGLFYITATALSGNGIIALHCNGAIEKHRVRPGQSIKVHRSHLVAWDNGVTHDMKSASSGWLGTLFSGQGILMAEFSGDGYVYLQTRKNMRYLITDCIKNQQAKQPHTSK